MAISERMLLPPWAKTAARVLSDEQLARTAHPEPQAVPTRTSCLVLGRDNLQDGDVIDETVGGTVSRKEKFGFTCEKCLWVPKFGDQPDWVSWNISCQSTPQWKSIGLHFPHRCRTCRSRMKRWTCAAKNYTALDTLRQLDGRPNLKFVTFTHGSWNVTIPFEEGWNAWSVAEELKQAAARRFRNFRYRNKYWISRDAKGMSYYECTMKTEYPFDGIKLHMHIHTVVCSKLIENQDIQINLDTLEPIPMSTTIQREWGGIVDVRACRTWKHKDGEIKTSKRFVMNYLLDYINKQAHWQSSRWGDWSN
jgi:hypothetical protein